MPRLLDNVRERCLRAEDAWNRMAERVARTEAMRRKRRNLTSWGELRNVFGGGLPAPKTSSETQRNDFANPGQFVELLERRPG